MRALIPLLVLTACADYGLSRPDEEDILFPVIQLDPWELDFPDAEPGDAHARTITVSNTGTTLLRVSSLELRGSHAFTLGAPPLPLDLGTGDSADLHITFDAINLENTGELLIGSTDPELPEIEVPLDGTGLIPRLLLAPPTHDFGPVGLGCTESTRLSLTNVGTAPLVIDDLVLAGSGFTLSTPTLPLHLDPTRTRTLAATYAPVGVGSHTARLWVTSNDSADDDMAWLSGRGVEPGMVTDTFVQGDPVARADVLIYVDRSGSMGDNAGNIIENFSAFADVLAELEIDWQMIVVTDDNGCHNQTYFTVDTEDLDEELYAALVGPEHTLTEAGLSIARNAMVRSAPGLCNEDFRRPGAKVSMLLVSDEPEQSRTPWSTLVGQILDLDPEVTIHAVAGPVPGGCETADAGSGYYEATVATGGAFLSICEDDWGARMDLLAHAAAGLRTTFTVSQDPREDSVQVFVDGEEILEGWHWSDGTNTVVFDVPPEAGSEVEVRYQWDGDC